MKVFCINIKSRSAFSVFLLLLALLLVLVEFVNINSDFSEKITTNEQRVNLINSLGYDILPEIIEEKNVVIPLEFSAVYNKYNQMQMQSGFDLRGYSGMDVTLYKYKINGEEKYVNILLHKGILIGGDVSSSRLAGEMRPLK